MFRGLRYLSQDHTAGELGLGPCFLSPRAPKVALALG